LQPGSVVVHGNKRIMQREDWTTETIKSDAPAATFADLDQPDQAAGHAQLMPMDPSLDGPTSDNEITSFRELEPDQGAAFAERRAMAADRASSGVMGMGFGIPTIPGFKPMHKGFPEPGFPEFTSKSRESNMAGGFPTTKEPKPTVAAMPHETIATIPKDLLGEYYRPNVILIRPELGTSPDTAMKVFERCQRSVKALERGFATVEHSRYRLRGNVEFGYEATKFELQVLRVEINETKQLAVDLKHITHTGRTAFEMLLQRISWDLSQDNLAHMMADGTDILRPMSDILAQLERERMEEDGYSDTDDELLAPPSMLGLSTVVTNRHTGRRKSNGIRLDNDESNELVKIWGNMLLSRERHAILKTIAHCSENEKNAEVLGTSTDLMKQIIEVLKSVGHHGEKDQQSVLCAMAIISNVMMVKAAAEFLIKTKIMEVLVDNLYYFSGIATKTSHARSTSIQDAAVESLEMLVQHQDGRDFVVTPDTRAKLEKVLLNLRKIRSHKSQEGLKRVCNALKL